MGVPPPTHFRSTLYNPETRECPELLFWAFRLPFDPSIHRVHVATSWPGHSPPSHYGKPLEARTPCPVETATVNGQTVQIIGPVSPHFIWRERWLGFIPTASNLPSERT